MKDLFLQSEFTNLITKILSIEFNKKFKISRIHNLLNSDGNTLFYIITDDNNKFLVNIMGKKIEGESESLLYWVENINSAGKIDKLFYAKDFLVLSFSRGEKYNNEFIFYIYQYGNQYPKIVFSSIDERDKYLDFLRKKYKQADLKDTPEDIKLI
jgi:hypothetical protein